MSCEDIEMSCLRGRTSPLKSHSAAAVLMVMMRAYKSMVGVIISRINFICCSLQKFLEMLVLDSKFCLVPLISVK